MPAPLYRGYSDKVGFVEGKEIFKINLAQKRARRNEVEKVKDFLEDLGVMARGAALAVIVLVPTSIVLVYLFVWASWVFLPTP